MRRLLIIVALASLAGCWDFPAERYNVSDSGRDGMAADQKTTVDTKKSTDQGTTQKDKGPIKKDMATTKEDKGAVKKDNGAPQAGQGRTKEGRQGPARYEAPAGSETAARPGRPARPRQAVHRAEPVRQRHLQGQGLLQQAMQRRLPALRPDRQEGDLQQRAGRHHLWRGHVQGIGPDQGDPALRLHRQERVRQPDDNHRRDRLPDLPL